MGKALGTMDTLMMSIAKALPINESTNEKFTAGPVSKVQPKKDLSEQMKQAKLALNQLEIPSIPGVTPKLEEVAPVEKPAPSQTKQPEWRASGIDTSAESFIADSLTKANLILMDLQKREGLIANEVASLRGAQDYNKAKNLRYAYKSLRYAIDDLKDACELVKSLLE